jgi:hypothetical protein
MLLGKLYPKERNEGLAAPRDKSRRIAGGSRGAPAHEQWAVADRVDLLHLHK